MRQEFLRLVRNARARVRVTRTMGLRFRMNRAGWGKCAKIDTDASLSNRDLESVP